MPSKSPKQRRFMAAAANNPDFARRAGIPQSVAREYHEADRARMFEGGLAPMGDIIQRGFAGGLERLAPGFKKGGRKRARREEEGYDKAPRATGRKGSKISYGNWGTTRKKGWRAADPQTRSGRERQRRRKMQRRQAEGRWGEDVMTNVKNPRKRRNLVRAGWIPSTPVESRKGRPGGKRYDYGLTKDTVFYPPTEVPTAFGGGTGLPRTIQRRDPMSYIGAEGGHVEPVNMFYGGPLRRRMNEIIAAQQAKKREEDPNWEDWMYYGTGPVTYKDIPGSGGIKKVMHVAKMRSLGWVPDKSGEGVDLKTVTWYPPQRTPFGQADENGGGSGYIPPASQDQPPTGGGRGRRGRGRRGRTPPGRGYTPPEPRDVPGGVTPPGREEDGGLVPPAEPPIDYTPPDPRAGRDTAFSEQLLAHRQRVAQLLGRPYGGMAEGGDVRSPAHYIPASREVGYAEGGEADGTSRADNPYPKGSARWKLWERKHGRDPDAPEPEPEAPPVAQAEEEEDPGFLGRLFGRSERELEEMDQAEGGYIPASREVGYQMGGMAELREAALSRPMGGVPPRVDMQMGGMARPAVMPGRGRFMPGRLPPTRGPQGDGGLARMIRRLIQQRGPSGMPDRSNYPRMSPPLKVPPGMRMAPPPGKEMPAGPEGGPRVPPNLRGFLQRRMMENRPRRGIPGPAGAGGAPNRVGQSDQQGGLARALQRGTGRAPMSRRQGFYR